MRLLPLLLLTGCAGLHGPEGETVDSVRVAIHRVAEVGSVCRKVTGVSDIFLACAAWNRQEKTCDVYVSEKPSDFVLAHEVNHCIGIHH